MHDAPQPWFFWAPSDIIRYTTEELLCIAAQYAIGKEAVEPLPILGGREAFPTAAKRCRPTPPSKVPRAVRRSESHD
jgi:hypothetical protein